MATIVFSPEAVTDLTGIKNYIAEVLQNPGSSIKTVSHIVERIEQLSVFPESGPSLSNLFGFETPYRFLNCDAYLVFYRNDGDTVRIVRVLGSSQDYLEILFG